MVVTLLPTSMKQCNTVFLSSYCPTITPLLLIPPGAVVIAPGTLTFVNLKVKVGAAATVATHMNATTDTDASSTLQLFIGTSIRRHKGRKFYLLIRRVDSQGRKSGHSRRIGHRFDPVAAARASCLTALISFPCYLQIPT